MESERVIFGPELEGLLRELAADPRSQLLRRPRPASLAGLLERPPLVRSTRTGLTVAERHLVEVHRDELADVLRRACLMRFFADPERAMYLNRSRDATTQIEVDTPEQWRARAIDALADARRSPEPLEGIDLLEACLRPAPGQRITITQLARASQLLQPTDTAEAYVGLDLVLSGRHSAAGDVLGLLIQAKPESRIASCAYEALGLSAGLTVGDHEAMDLYRLAHLADGRKPDPLMSWLYFATRAGDVASLREAAIRLDAITVMNEGMVTAFVDAHAKQDQNGAERPSREATMLANRMKETVGSRSRRILDAF